MMTVLAGGWQARSPSLASWGKMKLGHGLPNATSTGMNAVLMAVADALHWPNKTALTADAVQSDAAVHVCLVAACVQWQHIIFTHQGLTLFEDRVEHVLNDNLELLDFMLDNGPEALDAVASYEPTVLWYAQHRAADIARWNDSLVFVYLNHTMWDTHPYCLVNASWVTPEAREAGIEFLEFLLSNMSYALMAKHGIRCAWLHWGVITPTQ